MFKNLLTSSNQNKKENFLIIFIFITIILLIYSRYNGNHHTDHKNIWLFLNGGFQNDLYEINSLPIRTSIYYLFFKKLGISLDNDNFGIIVHYSLSFFAFFYLYKILKKLFPELKKFDVFCIILAISIFEDIVLHTTKSSWIYHQTLSSSHAGLAFAFYFIFQTLNENKKNLFFSAPLFLLISIKVAWFSIGCAILYLFFKNKKIKDILWIIPCILISLIYILRFGDFSISEGKYFLFEEILRREAEETAIHLQDPEKIIFCIITFVLYYFLLVYFNKNKYQKFFTIIFITSILLFVVGGVYAKFGLYFYPEPKLLLLNPVRSLYYYQLFLSILYCVYVVKEFEGNDLKYSLLSIPFFMCLGYNGTLIALLIAISSLIYSFLKINLNVGKYIFVLLIFITVTNSTKNRFIKSDWHTYSKLNHWSTFVSGNNEMKDFFINIRQCDDFMLYDDMNLGTHMNFFAAKSKYYKSNALNVYLDYSFFKEHKRRQNLINSLESTTNISEISNENFLYVSNKIYDFEVETIKKDYVNLYFFFTDKRINQLKNNCPNLFD